MLSGKAKYLEGLYNEGKITEVHLNNAVSRGWITEDEKNLIMN
ncbi:MAG: hypothetical protein AWU54_1776 [Candidatus Frackibacter sp. T328-2]|jgi:hypothetical protein|nr:MAG: hypothetical protein AWU54_1776 [Candidatus Frackibacter sp. T328-2]